MSSYEEKLADARDFFDWFRAYQEAGFTLEQAMLILGRPAVTISPAQYPPEWFEFLERQNAFATRALQEMDGD